MPPKPSQCSVQGCTTAAKTRGMCGKHGNKRCSRSGCATTTQADGSGLCNRHGGGYRCVTPGCTKNVSRNNRCTRHQPVPPPGRSPVSQARGIRKRHGSMPCTTTGCTTLARSNGLCIRHGGGRCTVPGCTACAFRGGKCKPHMIAQSPPVSEPPPHLPSITRMQALTNTPWYSRPSWPEIYTMMQRARHLQPTPVGTVPRTHETPTRVAAPAEHDHLVVDGFGIRVSDSPGPGPSLPRDPSDP